MARFTDREEIETLIGSIPANAEGFVSLFNALEPREGVILLAKVLYALIPDELALQSAFGTTREHLKERIDRLKEKR